MMWSLLSVCRRRVRRARRRTPAIEAKRTGESTFIVQLPSKLATPFGRDQTIVFRCESLAPEGQGD